MNKLTKRECEVVQLLFQGLTLKEIAKELAIKPNTATAHARNLRVKLDAKNLHHVVAIALRNKYVT